MTDNSALDWERAYYFGGGVAAASWTQGPWYLALSAGVLTMLFMYGVIQFRHWLQRFTDRWRRGGKVNQ